jgi:toxin YoeB
LNLIAQDSYAYPPEFQLLKGEFKGAISGRINNQHRQDDLPQERDEWL